MMSSNKAKKALGNDEKKESKKEKFNDKEVKRAQRRFNDECTLTLIKEGSDDEA